MAASSQNSCLLCAPIVGKSVEEVLSQMQQAQKQGADCIELRIDHIKDFNPPSDLETILKARTLPAIVTYRPKWEGGEYEGDEASRLDTLRLALQYGAEYVDVELQVADSFMKTISDLKQPSSKIIVSNHNYQYMPSLEDLAILVARIQSTGADIVKFAATAKNVIDNARIFHVLANSQVPIIALGMSEKGLTSRLLSPKFGGYLTFATLESGKESAPGQPTLCDLMNIYNIRSIGRNTKVFGIIGNPVSHSKSPMLQNYSFREMGLDAIYVPFLVDDIEEFLRVYSSPDFAGFSVTIPYKEAALRCCDEVDPVAQSIRAVNTIVRRQSDGKLVGYNTDYTGAITAIEDALSCKNSHHASESVSPLNGKLFVVIGAGGAGRAVAFGAKQKGARIVVANRNFERAKALAGEVGGKAVSLNDLCNFHPENGMILANTTSVGMHPNVNATPVAKEALSSYSLVFDAVYTPKWTHLLQDAEAAGASVVSGIEMFIRQAMGQFELFTGLKAPEKPMRELASQNADAK